VSSAAASPAWQGDDADPSLLVAALPADPFDLLTARLPANDDPDRPQITLSTVDASGAPDARTVLLSEFDRSGLYFHTDARSRKAADIAGCPTVAITVLWPGFTRQLVVQGVAEVAPAAEIAAAYRSRSPYLQQLAWQNSQDFAQLPLDERRARWGAFLLEHSGSYTQPESWIGYLVRPTRLTFWGSNPDAASRRTEYRLSGGAWGVSFLPG
jgi:pyridoxamine 5'-phosphate oxidase